MSRELPLPNSAPLRVLSLFAGIGGLDLGLESHNCRTVAYSEIDPYAASIMTLRFPDAVNLGDITTIDWEDVAREHSIDIICGGFPCQDISFAGAGAGIAEGTRSGLWSCYADAIRILRPRGVLVENVSALLARGIDRVLGDLAACGLDAEWDCIPAAAVGAPHLRDRVFIVAYGADSCGEAGRPSGNSDIARAYAQPATSTPREAAGKSGGGHAGAGANAQRFGGERYEKRGARAALRWDRPVGSDYWRAEPGVGRVGPRIPNRVDRLRCLGNAVVPQVGEHVAGILMQRIEAAA